MSISSSAWVSRRFAAASLLVCLSAFLGACRTTAPDLPPPSGFRVEEAAFVHKSGAARLDGQAFLVLPDGKTRMAAGETVRLIPASAYAKARFAALYGDKTFIRAGDIPAVPVDPAYAQNMRTTTTSSGGAFRFENLAAGDYFVTTQKIWREPGKFSPQGGAMYLRVSIANAERRKIIVVGR